MLLLFLRVRGKEALGIRGDTNQSTQCWHENIREWRRRMSQFAKCEVGGGSRRWAVVLLGGRTPSKNPCSVSRIQAYISCLIGVLEVFMVAIGALVGVSDWRLRDAPGWGQREGRVRVGRFVPGRSRCAKGLLARLYPRSEGHLYSILVDQ